MQVCEDGNINQWGKQLASSLIQSHTDTHRGRQHRSVVCALVCVAVVASEFVLFFCSLWAADMKQTSRWAKTKNDGFRRLSLRGGRLSSPPAPNHHRPPLPSAPPSITPALLPRLQLASRAARTRTVVDGFELPPSDPAEGLRAASRDAAGNSVDVRGWAWEGGGGVQQEQQE